MLTLLSNVMFGLGDNCGKEVFLTSLRVWTLTVNTCCGCRGVLDALTSKQLTENYFTEAKLTFVLY